MFCKKCGKELTGSISICPNCGTSLSIRSVINVFNAGKEIWEEEITNNDCFVYPVISEKVKSLIRQNFKIKYNEQILFVRDTSFWDTLDQGLAITDGGIYCIPDNDKPDEKIILSWNAIKRVEYKDLILYFWGYNGTNDYQAIHLSFFMKNDHDDATVYWFGDSLAELFSRIAEQTEGEADALDLAIKKYEELLNEDREEEALQYALECKETIERGELFYLEINDLYYKKGEYEKSIFTCNEGLKHCDPASTLATWLFYARYSSYYAIRDYDKARKDGLMVMKKATDNLKRDDGILIKEEATSGFKICDQKYIEQYLDMPYHKRKILLPVNEYTDLSQEYLSVIHIKNLPAIEFPMGHPIANQLYVGHPYLKQKYIPFENYELELIEDKVREFCQIVQNLGATEITIECINSTTSDKNIHSRQNISGEASLRLSEASASYQKQRRSHFIDEISQSINLHQSFTPTKSPSLPERLVWYPKEPSWQRLYEQRIQGGLLQHEERIETRKNRVVERTELKAIEGEFKNLILEAKGHWNKKDEEKFELQENAILSIHIHFAPLETLNENSSKVTEPQCKITALESEYLEELKLCLGKNNELTAGERRLLEKLRIHLNISETRAQELENSLIKPTLTQEEKEYLDEYRYCLENNGEISSLERRLLDKLIEKLNIPRERIKEIEKLA